MLGLDAGPASCGNGGLQGQQQPPLSRAQQQSRAVSSEGSSSRRCQRRSLERSRRCYLRAAVTAHRNTCDAPSARSTLCATIAAPFLRA
ncbi:Os12g0214600 [Oryza sativa Japonica Group]|uniref:Os12g0214600 protein n=1 Tax=Oryza sativa subsp. japonica TaxID=39947 RepID=A0A0P0Y858_ORYSJ|nr:Os12g0214600 [Oryza sativa Japonica Group]